jgi:ferrous iron transport protein B
VTDITTTADDDCPKSIALVGNPNCGKTTLFNGLTGSRYKVANYPGVTVERKEGSLPLPHGSCAKIVDLPGTYALVGSSLDEKIVTQFLRGEIAGNAKPDLIVAVVDATNLERNLFLISELIDTGYPIVLAINMMDAAERAGIKVYGELLSRALDLPVVPITARTKSGFSTLVGEITRALETSSASSKKLAWIPSEHPLRKTIEGLNPLGPASSDASVITTIGSLRYAWIRSIVRKTTSQSSNDDIPVVSPLDRILTSRVWGLPIMLGIFGLIFQAIFLWAQFPMELISGAVDSVSAWASSTLPPGILTNLIAEGIIPGVGNVVVFVPQIAILFLCIGFLEDSGYLSRAAFLLDNFMRKVGLQGRAFIPLLSSFACAVPGILSTRSIPTRSDRLATIMIAPLMSCSARLPVYAVLIAAFIPPTLVGGFVSLQGLVLLGMYILGVVGACAVAWLLKKCLLWKESCFYVMEMPPLRKPILRIILRGVYDSVASFLKNATTIILACSVIVWFLASYPKPDAGYQGNPVQVSYAGQLGTAIEPVIKPLGFNWEIGIAILSSFPAREVFVTTLSTIYNISDDDDEHTGLVKTLQERNRAGLFSTLTALSLMVFYVFACMCMSTLAVCKRETGSWGWALGMFGYMTTLAYLASFTVFQVGSLFLK